MEKLTPEQRAKEAVRWLTSKRGRRRFEREKKKVEKTIEELQKRRRVNPEDMWKWVRASQ